MPLRNAHPIFNLVAGQNEDHAPKGKSLYNVASEWSIQIFPIIIKTIIIIKGGGGRKGGKNR